MANEGQPVDSAEFYPNDEIDELFARGNPNPTREGCPPRDVLIALAKRERPISDRGYEHLAGCSPCYKEARAYQAAQVRERRAAAIRMVTWAATAAVVVLGVTWVLFRGRDNASSRIEVARQESRSIAVRAELDLRNYVGTRSQRDKIDQQPLVLSRALLSLTIRLPGGSEPGIYEIQILDSELRSKATSVGEAEIRNYITTLQTTIDLGSVMPGGYQFGLRRRNEEWLFFPAQVR
jgi:hypothetical protein